MFIRIILLAGLGSFFSTSLLARDYVSMKGSSTVFPFATIVAEQLGKNPRLKTPVVESGGSSVGKKGVHDFFRYEKRGARLFFHQIKRGRKLF